MFSIFVKFYRNRYGKILALDGNVRCTERDEFVYHETISFLPLCAHPNPKNVLVIGSENGGIVREVTKHPLVKNLTHLIQDRKLVEICKKYFSTTAIAFESSKLQTEYEEISKFLRGKQATYDVIIVDLHNEKNHLFEAVKQSLEPENGIFCCNSELPWVETDKIAESILEIKENFGNVQYATANIPSYPTGKAGFFLASVNTKTEMRELKNEINPDDLNLKYYTREIHRASFALPYFMKKRLK